MILVVKIYSTRFPSLRPAQNKELFRVLKLVARLSASNVSQRDDPSAYERKYWRHFPSVKSARQMKIQLVCKKNFGFAFHPWGPLQNRILTSSSSLKILALPSVAEVRFRNAATYCS